MDFSSITTNPTDTRNRAIVDFDFFAGLALPDVMTVSLPAYYIAIAALLITESKNKERFEAVLKFALGLPRGFIKTTFIKVLVAYFIVHNLCDFALVVCATEFHAENVISDIDSILSSPNIRTLYGDWGESRLTDSKSLKRNYYHQRPVILAGLGAGSSLRGINIDNRRPDFLVCDDMQTKENDDSPTESKRLFQWFVGTLIKAVNLKWCLIAYIGNMYSDNCILFKLKKHPQWRSLITGCILADGQSLWPEMHSVDSLYESFKHDEILGMAHVWFAEMQNEPVESGTSILGTGHLPIYPYADDIEPDGRFLVIDPAGFRRTSDDNVIARHAIIDDVGVVEEILADKYNPEQVITLALEQVITYNIPVIGIEATGYQQTLKFWLDKYIEDHELGDLVTVVELHTRKRSKESRIITWFKEAQEVVVETELSQVIRKPSYYVKREEDRQRVTYQALQYKVGKTNNKDDLLDGCAYGLDMREEHWGLIKEMFKPYAHTQYANARVVANNTSF